MKKLSLFVSAFALCASTSYADINCGKLPSCADLGYVDKIGQCPSIASPAGRENAKVTYQRQYIKCPFSNPSVWAETEVKCLHPAAVGQIGYFTADPGRGWILCDGQAVSKKQYPQLANLLDSQFGGSATTFNVPNYKGYFLRVSGTPNSNYGRVGNTNLTTPQKEGLPNITGSFTSVMIQWEDENYSTTSTFNKTVQKSSNGDNPSAFALELLPQNKGANAQGRVYSFNASRYNSIYGASTGVTPPNMAVYAYIYAGLVVE